MGVIFGLWSRDGLTVFPVFLVAWNGFSAWWPSFRSVAIVIGIVILFFFLQRVRLQITWKAEALGRGWPNVRYVLSARVPLPEPLAVTRKVRLTVFSVL